MSRRKPVIAIEVIEETERLLALARKRRKRLTPAEEKSFFYIDAPQMWGDLQRATVGMASFRVPKDVLRIILCYLPIRAYLQIAPRLNKKFYGWAKEDAIVVHLSVSKTCDRLSKHSMTSSWWSTGYYAFYRAQLIQEQHLETVVPVKPCIPLKYYNTWVKKHENDKEYMWKVSKGKTNVDGIDIRFFPTHLEGKFIVAVTWEIRLLEKEKKSQSLE